MRLITHYKLHITHYKLFLKQAAEETFLFGRKFELSLFGDGERRDRCLRLEKTMDALRLRYGHTALSRASVLCDPTLTNIDAKNDHTIHPVGYLKAGQSVR